MSREIVDIFFWRACPSFINLESLNVDDTSARFESKVCQTEFKIPFSKCVPSLSQGRSGAHKFEFYA